MREKNIIRQHNVITEARYHMTALEKDVIYMLLSQLKEEDVPKKIYAIKVGELEHLLGKRIARGDFYKTAKRLVDLPLYTNSKNKGTIKFNFLSAGRHKSGKGIIYLELSQEVRTFLFALKNNFTLLSLKIALSLKGKHTKRIYEMLCQYRDTGIFTITINDFKERLGIIDFENREDKYPKYGLLKAYVLEPSKKEINEHAEFKVDYIAKKTGRKYTHLIFSIKRRSDKVLTAEYDQNIPKEELSTLHKRMISTFKLSLWQAKIISKEVTLSEINKTLYEIQLEKVNGKVRNIGGYTANVFDKKFGLNLLKN